MITKKSIRFFHIFLLCATAFLSFSFLPSDSHINLSTQNRKSGKLAASIADLQFGNVNTGFLTRYYHLWGDAYKPDNEIATINMPANSTDRTIFLALIAYRKGDYTTSFSLLKKIFFRFNRRI